MMRILIESKRGNFNYLLPKFSINTWALNDNLIVNNLKFSECAWLCDF